MNPPPEKKVDKVVEGVVLRKKSGGRRALDSIFGGDPNGVISFVIMDVVLPAAREMIVDSFSTFMERLVYGESRSGGRQRTYRSSATGSPYVQYNRYSPTQQASRLARDEPRETRPESRSLRDTDEFIFQTYAEAQEVVDRMYLLLQQYEQVTLSDFYSMIDISGNYTDETRGWTDLAGTRIRKVRGGFVVDTPPKENLKP